MRFTSISETKTGCNLTLLYSNFTMHIILKNNKQRFSKALEIRLNVFTEVALSECSECKHNNVLADY